MLPLAFIFIAPCFPEKNMVGVAPFLGFFAVFGGVFYQFLAQPFLHNKLGIGRTIHKIRDQSCDKITEFEACESECDACCCRVRND